MIYEPFSIVVVPFPFTDQHKQKKRPALVLSNQKFQRENGHATLMMITTAKNSQWFGDHLIKELKTTKLPAESYIRQKLFTIDLRLIEKKIGKLSDKDITALKKLLKQSLPI